MLLSLSHVNKSDIPSNIKYLSRYFFQTQTINYAYSTLKHQVSQNVYH